MKKISLQIISILPIFPISLSLISCYNKEKHTAKENFDMFVKYFPQELKGRYSTYKEKALNIDSIEYQFNHYFHYFNTYEYRHNGILSRFQPLTITYPPTYKLAIKYIRNSEKDYLLRRQLGITGKLYIQSLNLHQKSKEDLKKYFKKSDKSDEENEKDFKEITKYINVDKLRRCQNLKTNGKRWIRNLLINIKMYNFDTEDDVEYNCVRYIDIWEY
ncbi:hypothetical protein PT309_03325 [Metamycoplasma hyosynoviae]|uniref:Lipoprotein n=3 Tax=Metamycoplasma hyosynoviae TaxID=29559 RepID=A0A4R7TXV6_9BACT|nr:hypothetical protein [Metamycoplasma hyosynoviae]MDD1373910.1 hypothetical protein [Metamycoplasma hyosynoviae]TDU97785.1 hypothetical protein JN03_0301 [Metamycoplasma hyosynoviae]